MNGDDAVTKSDKLDQKLAVLPVTDIFTRRQVVVGFAIVMAIMLAAFTVMFVQIHDLTVSSSEKTQAQNACRFAASTEVNTISDNLDALTAELFVVAVANPRQPGDPQPPRIVELGKEMGEQVELLRPALIARERAVNECNE